MITAFASPDDAVTAMKNGAFDYITKPFNVDEIKGIVGSARPRRSAPTAGRGAGGGLPGDHRPQPGDDQNLRH